MSKSTQNKIQKVYFSCPHQLTVYNWLNIGINIYFSLTIQCILPDKPNNSPKIQSIKPYLNIHVQHVFNICQFISVSRCSSGTGVIGVWCLSDCKDCMPLVLDMESQIIQQELITDNTNLPGILSLHYSLVDIGSNLFIFCKWYKLNKILKWSPSYIFSMK